MDELPAPRILVVDDEEAMAVFVKRTLRRNGYEVETASDGERALDLAKSKRFDLVVTDLKMPVLDGMGLLRRLRESDPSVRVIVMTGHGSIPTAIEALKSGADDYITKPFDAEEILRSVEQSLLSIRLRSENRMLKRLLDEGRRFEGLTGSSSSMRSLYRQIEDVAMQSSPVLVMGESGTGKELVARAIHQRSPRRSEPFVGVHCAAMPGHLMIAELFGVEEGAFTGATVSRRGAVRRAEGGVLFLDEIAEIPLEVQPALLKLLEGGEVMPLGAKEPVRVDLRIVAATHRELRRMVDEGTFRADLFYRLNVFVLAVPPLRRRREDVPDLIRTFLAKLGREDSDLTVEARSALLAFDWPGNVRQLENTLARMTALSAGGVLSAELLPEEILVGAASTSSDEFRPHKSALREFERDYLVKLLHLAKGNISEAARRAEISRPTLHAKIAQYGLDPDEYR